MPYAKLDDPQSLNLYSYVRNSPVDLADPDGHSFWDFVGGVINGTASDGVGGALRAKGNGDFTTGQKVGDALAAVGGIVEMVGGASSAGGGIAACATGVGCAAGAPAIAAGAVIGVHGAVETRTALQNLFKSPHGNTAGTQPAELYEKYDKDGNFEKHGVSQDAQKRYTKKEIDGGEVRVTDRGPRNEMLAKERENVETNPGPKNKEKWAGKKKVQQQQ